MGRLTATLVMLLCLLLPEGTAAANDANNLFNRALDFAREGKTDKAVELWVQVLDAVEPRYRPSVHKALGLAYGELGRLPEAIYHLAAYLDTQMAAEAGQSRERLQKLEERAAAGHQKITVACEPSGAIVQIGSVGYACPLDWWFAPGEYALPVQALGYEVGTLVLSVGDRPGKALHVISLKPSRPAPQDAARRQERKYAEIAEAAGFGHGSVLKRLALENPELFRGLPCEFGWNPALKALQLSDCHDDLFAVLLDSGSLVCSDSRSLVRVAEAGCVKAMDAMLSETSDADLPAALMGFETSPRYSASVSQAQGILTCAEHLLARLTPLCEPGDRAHLACRALTRMDQELASFYRGMSGRKDEEAFLGILALVPSWTRQYRCEIVREIAASVQGSRQCDEAAHKLSRFYDHHAKDCSLGTELVGLVRSRCQPVLGLLLPDAVPEDVAAASMEYNSNNYYMPEVLPAETRIDPTNALSLGKMLVDANRRTCDDSLTGTRSCEAARRVEHEMERIRERAREVERPETVLKELCLVQGDLDALMDDLARERRIAELSGSPNGPALQQLATQIVPMEKRLELLSEQYTKLSRKKYSKGLCTGRK